VIVVSDLYTLLVTDAAEADCRNDNDRLYRNDNSRDNVVSVVRGERKSRSKMKRYTMSDVIAHLSGSLL